MANRVEAVSGLLEAVEMDLNHKHWKWMLALGVLMAVLGLFSLGAPLMAALAMDLMAGWVLVIGGAGQAVHALQRRGADHWGGTLAAGVLYLIAGVVMLVYPWSGVVALTLFMAVFFLAEGFVKLRWGLAMRPKPRWGWVAANGVLAIVVGAVIGLGLPGTSLWALGLLVGIDLLFGGLMLISLAMGAKEV